LKALGRKGTFAKRSGDLEFNLAENAEAMKTRSHPGYEQTALDGISLSLKAINEQRIKIVVNGGALNPKGLAEEVVKLVRTSLEYLTENLIMI
jgi:hypothetical protein